MGYTTGSLSVEGEIEGGTQLGETPNSEGHQVVSRVCKLLLPLCFEICGDSSPTNVFDKERCGDAVGSSSAASVPVVEGRPMRCANVSLPRSETTIHNGNGCCGDGNRGCFDARSG